MFSRKDQLLRKTGPDGIGRFDFLRLLKKEFLETKSEESKKQVLANLANFAYDPINYDYFRELQLLDLMLEQVCSQDEELLQFSIAGLCNLSSDPNFRDDIINKNGVELISPLLFKDDVEIVLNTITLFIYLKPGIQFLPANISNQIQKLQKHSNSRLKNLAVIFFDNNESNTTNSS